MLNKLNDLENNIYLSIDNNKRVFAVSDEDLERTKDGKTSAVHFLRFQLDQDVITAFLSNKKISIGVDHNEYKKEIELESEARASLAKDLTNN